MSDTFSRPSVFRMMVVAHTKGKYDKLRHDQLITFSWAHNAKVAWDAYRLNINSPSDTRYFSPRPEVWEIWQIEVIAGPLRVVSACML